jgi:hypothetical protein
MLSSSDNVRGAWVRAMQTQGGPQPCPVCEHRPQLRQHVFTATMALALIHLYHRQAVAVEGASIPEIVKTGDSLKKLALWGLVRHWRHPDSGEESYALTNEGLEVVLKRRTVTRHCVAAHGLALWFWGSPVWIDDTLSQRYSYDDLMRVPA